MTTSLPASTLSSRRAPLADPREQLARLEAVTAGRASFQETLRGAGWPDLTPASLEIFQINLGKLCNMTCRHCHVDAGPDRSDTMMTRETVDACLRALDQTSAHTVDITGGAPELHPEFRYLVDAAHARGKHVIDRCNLSVLLLQRNAGLAEWLAERDVEIVASLPHYRQRNTDAQRGDGAFEKSIAALRLLNTVGYGQGDPRRILSLMTNPAGAFLAAPQSSVESEWKTALHRDFGITFDLFDHKLIAKLKKQFGPHRYGRIDTHFPLEKRGALMEFLQKNSPAKLLRSPLSDMKSYDGVKFVAQDTSWLMLRGSGTEPILRIYAEAASDADVRNLLKLGVRLTRQV